MSNTKEFEIPVVIFLFKRINTLERIFDQLRKIKPSKLYLIADGPRGDFEKKEIDEVRKKVIELIDWECTIIKNFSDFNRGVYENIAGGAKWVFEKETSAIFIEDDNLPDPSFFQYCQELLEKYENNEKVLWITGTNYLEEYNSEYSYMFTRHLLPCGWASWSKKFNKYYDGDLEILKKGFNINKLKKKYISKALFRQQKYLLNLEFKRMKSGIKPISWDYQMDFTLKYYDLYGISPAKNLINNIGVDIHSIHGGNSFEDEMTRRFCGINERETKFPLIHPSTIKIDEKYEKKIGKILLYPKLMRLRIFISSRGKRILRKLGIIK